MPESVNVRTFGNLSINCAGIDYRLNATSGSLTLATSNTFSIQ